MISRETRGRIRTVAEKLGIEKQARSVWEWTNPETKRGMQDMRHLRMLIAFSLDSDANCIDIGANRGDVVTDMVRLCPDGHHIAYEPLPAFQEILRKEFPKVDVRGEALWNEMGSTTFEYVKEEPVFSGLRTQEYPGDWKPVQIEVETVPLDDALDADYVPALIKLDVEGAERQVLEGARKTLETHRPILFFEHGWRAAGSYGTTSGDIHDLLVKEIGMRIFDADGKGPYTRAQFEAAQKGLMHNYVARF